MSLSKSEIDGLKSSVKISDIVGRHVTWDRKKSKPRRGDYWACCPFHGDRNPSFHCDDGRAIYKCFSCGVSGDVISFLTDYVGLSFRDAIREIGGDPGREMSPEQKRKNDERAAEYRRRAAEREAEQEETDEQRRRVARALFKAGRPIGGTLGEQYLLRRGIAKREWPDSLRFIQSLEHDLERGRKFPALVGGVADVAGEITAIWRIYLDPETAGKAPVANAKLGKGPSAGGAVRLGKAAQTIAVAEGMETGLAVAELTGLPTWAALSTSGMAGLELPDIVRHVDIYADGDAHRFHAMTGKLEPSPGIEAAMKLRDRAIKSGRTCEIHPPPDWADSSDWLDVLNDMKALQHEE